MAADLAGLPPLRFASELPREPLFQESAQFRRCLELRDRVELLESRRERVGQTPQCPRPELFILRLEVEVVHPPSQVLGNVECFARTGVKSPLNAMFEQTNTR